MCAPLWERLYELLWLLDYLDDIESDLSVFHRVDDWRSMAGPRFFRLAVRLAAYNGVMHARALATSQDDAPSGTQAANDGQVARVDGTREAIETDPVLSSLITFA